MKKSVYSLYFLSENEPVVFYVGCSEDVKRRLKEHKSAFLNPKHAEFDTFKYRLCRELQELGIEFEMQVIIENAELDEDDEYHWILMFARYNEDAGIAFYDNMPLTNMKAGDFLDEMVRDRTITTGQQVRAYRQRKRESKISSYQRSTHNSSVWNPAGRQLLAQLDASVQERRRQRKIKEEKQAERRAKKDAEFDTWLAEQRRLFEEQK